MAVAASCRNFLDAVARQLALKYQFDCTHKEPTMGDVLRAQRGQEGKDWSIHKALKDHYQEDNEGYITIVKKGTPLTTIRLPDLFTGHEWNKLCQFNDVTNKKIHSAELPLLRAGTPYIILPHDDCTPDMIDFLKTIGVKSSLFPDKSWLEVKDEDNLSEGSSLG